MSNNSWVSEEALIARIRGRVVAERGTLEGFDPFQLQRLVDSHPRREVKGCGCLPHDPDCRHALFGRHYCDGPTVYQYEVQGPECGAGGGGAGEGGAGAGAKVTVDHSVASDVLGDGRLYVGNHVCAAKQGAEFDLVVNCTPNLPFAASESGQVQVRIPVDDCPDDAVPLF